MHPVRFQDILLRITGNTNAAAKVPTPCILFERRQTSDAEEQLEELRDRERTQLLHALKAKWDTVNEKYQLMVGVLVVRHVYH